MNIRSDRTIRLPTPDGAILRLLSDEGGTYEVAVSDPGQTGCLGMVWTAADVAKACGWSVTAVNAIGVVIGADGRKLDKARPDLTLYMPSQARRIRSTVALMLSGAPREVEPVERAEQPAVCETLDDALADIQITSFTDLFDGIDGGLSPLAVDVANVLRGVQTRGDKMGKEQSSLSKAIERVPSEVAQAVLDQLAGGCRPLLDVIRDVRGRPALHRIRPTAGDVLDAIALNVRLGKVVRTNVRGEACLVLR